MASSKPDSGQLRVMLWSNPRTLSTVFLKCMSFVDGTQAINEPYSVARLNGPDRTLPTDPETLASMKGFEENYEDVRKIEIDLPKGFDEDICTFKWVKELLEAPYPDSKLVFCKDQAFAIHGKFHMLPKGYRHTFLIRNPYKIYPSWKNVLLNLMPPEVRPQIRFDQLPEFLIPKDLGLGELHDLLQYVKENIDSNPIIIDADDLQSHPVSILRQYCDALGIPFNESMLSWEAGDAIVQSWIASNFYVKANKTEKGGYFDEALKSTQFHPSKPIRKREDLPEDILACIDRTMPVYKEMYEMRLRP